MEEKREKIDSLSPTEQKIYSELYSERVINTDDVRAILGYPHKSADYITRLREKGYLQKIKKGLYAVVPPNLVGEEVKPDKFLIAGKTKDEYYISHHSALELHGIAQSVHNTVLITSETQSESFTYQSITYRFVTTQFFFGFEKMNHQGVEIKVGDREKTFLDCVRRIKYAGGLEELMKSLDNLPSLDWDKFKEYLEIFDEKKLYQKAGFVLENLSLRVPEKTMMEMKKKVGGRTYYLDKDKKSSLNREWNLMVPKNFRELTRGA